MSETEAPRLDESDIPRGNAAGFRRYLKQDLISGFLVFLIALPLCLGISLSYGYPAIAGVFTAIIGGIVTTFISNSELTIKGPAAGLIAIAAPCVMSFGWNGVAGDVNIDAYRSALAVGVAAGIIQILMGLFRVGSLGEFFPSSVVHGMLAAIGVIIICKMFPLALGVKVGGAPLTLLLGVPTVIQNYEPTIAIIGVVSVSIMFLWPLVKVKYISSIPAALVVLAVAIPLANTLDLSSKHTNSVSLKPAAPKAADAVPKDAESAAPAGTEVAAVEVSEKPAAKEASDTLIHVPAFGETFSSLTFPKFDALLQLQAWQWVFMFAIIGTLESMLSAKAMDLIDPWQRKTSLDRDNIAVGIGNTLCSFVGAAPMISEIVRSRANMDNGARTRFADMFHGIFLLAFVCLLPFIIGMIPVAALMAMLVFTGYRLAHPKEFVHVFEIGPEQLIVYCVTLVGCFAIDLLAGIAIGIVVKLVIHVLSGASIGSLFKPQVVVSENGSGVQVISVSQSAVFSNWLGLKKLILKAATGKEVILDLSETCLVDHTVMSNLNQLKKELTVSECTLVIRGLEGHTPVSKHKEATLRKINMHATGV
ncbi:MAG: SulP family inorganic anion transporter [Rhodopirellula sp.]|nr:SulP family inorganic anion transporter [Rhodopirellula sp.]